MTRDGRVTFPPYKIDQYLDQNSPDNGISLLALDDYRGTYEMSRDQDPFDPGRCEGDFMLEWQLRRHPIMLRVVLLLKNGLHVPERKRLEIQVVTAVASRTLSKSGSTIRRDRRRPQLG